MKKIKKKKVDSKKVAIYITIVITFLLMVILINEIVISKRQEYSEILAIGNVEKNKFEQKKAILTSYNEYKKFLKDNNIKKGNLKKVDFKKNNYILLTETYAKNVESKMKQVKGISNSYNSGLSIEMDSYDYCDDVTNLTLLAYLIPISNETTNSLTNIEVTYNKINSINCNAQ